MKRILLAALLTVAPALAHAQSDSGDRWDDRDESDAQWDGDPSWAEPEPAQTSLDFQSDSALDANGRWLETPEYGVVWQPTAVSPSWQPYRYGRWAFTDAGWTWVSDEPFGWAVYHYGRWGFSPVLGWYWIPGRVWAPAWVEWRYGDRYAGWCAMGPRGVAVLQPARWTWIETATILQPVQRHVVPLPAHVVSALPAPVTGPRAGPPVRVVERAIGRPVVPVAAATVTGPRATPRAPTSWQPRIWNNAASPRPAQVAPRPAQVAPRANAAGPRAQTPFAAPGASAPPRTAVTAPPRAPVAPSAPHAAGLQPRTAPAPTRAPGGAPAGAWASRIAPPHARPNW